MIRFLILLSVSYLIISTCTGCSFVKDQLIKLNKNNSTEENPQQNQRDSQEESKPIPINPQHS